jgi:hypothetical protein
MEVFHVMRTQIGLLVLGSTAIAALVACGGGGGGGGSTTAPPAVNFGTNAPLPSNISESMTMSCVDGAGWQCGGVQSRRTEHGITVTASGVQAYGHSTSDLATPNLSTTTATGLAPDTTGTGIVDARFLRTAQGTVTRAALIMSNIGISWDGTSPRPQAIEVFENSQGITKLGAGGALSWTDALPPSTNTNYYNYDGAPSQRTAANYANNRYFPKPGDSSACPNPLVPGAGTLVETCGVSYSAGPFRAGGTDPDRTTAKRLHSDGDVKAGRTGGVPFPGNKGYRDLIAYSFDYANIATWVSEETVEIDEWAGLNNEHTSNRRGAVAFGDTTNPPAVPSAGGVDYKGVAYGWYSPDGATTVYFRATATVSVNFDSRQVAVRISDAKEDGNPSNAVAFGAEVTAGLGASGSNVSNYFVGAATSSANSLTGGLGGRLFGPVGQGPFTTNQGPAEIAGSFTLKNSTSKAATIGGFIGRRQ